MLLIGSKALEKWGVRLLRQAKDTDYIATFEEYNNFVWNLKHTNRLKCAYPISDKNFVVMEADGNIYEFEIAWPGSSGESLIEILKDQDELYRRLIVKPEVVLALKESHKYKKNSPHFKKTMDDIILLKSLGYTVPEYLKDWLKKREEETYHYHHPNLNQSKEGFFDSSVNYVYDHDSIHQVMKHLDKPAYEYYKSDNAEVFCDKEKFFSLPEIIRLYGVLEETYVLALERSQIPFPQTDPYKSFLMALEKVCTSITSGWFREYSWLSYYKIIELYEIDLKNDFNYVERFKQGLTTGNILEFTAERRGQ